MGNGEILERKFLELCLVEVADSVRGTEISNSFSIVE